MNEVSIIEEFLKCLELVNHLKSQNVILAKLESNFLVIAYVLSWIISKQSRYLVAFLFVESFTMWLLYRGVDAVTYFQLSTVVACFICYVGEITKFNLKALLGYVIICLFELTMVADAYFYSEVETVLYSYYEYIIVAIHLYIIASLFRWSRIRKGMGRYLDGIFGISSNGYSASFLLYNAFKATIKPS